MIATNGLLVPLASTQMAKKAGYQDEFARKLFGSFRDVFAAERLPERAVFWVDNKAGHLIVRHVRNLERQRKSADQLVGKVPDDLDAVRVLIGNFASGCKLSTVRWELYGDFELSDQLDMGRFDYTDLTYGIDPDKVSVLTAQRVFPAGDWDFDSIILMHRCQTCRKVFDKRSILYLPNKQCDSCGKVPAWGDAQRIVKDMVLGYMERLDKITTHHTELPEGEFAVQYFVDPIPNSVMYWLLSIHQGKTQPEPERIFGSADNVDYEKWLKAMYHRSLLSFMVSDFTRKKFTAYMEERHGDCEILLKQWQRIGESLRTPFQVAAGMTDREGFLAHDLDIQFALKDFPALINMIIVEHLNHQTPEVKVLTHDDND